ncbi:hypothetical protein Dxin01_04262 [Deinococcus xinjiangensis]|uniref:Site-specific DNA-methyltransferase (adenine-specific) n=1 Tax=Deinococcus xinjiangensis TaxID=457454 RepID=A0ABP9VLD0_9DEIO
MENKKRGRPSKKSKEESHIPPLEFETFDYKGAFTRIRNYLAGRHIGGTRDEHLLDELLKCLFTRLFLERKGSVLHGLELPPSKYRESYKSVCKSFSIFDSDCTITLDDDCISYIDNELKDLTFHESERDPIGDAYEIFTGSHIRGQDGQFFTPKSVTKWLVEAINPDIEENLIDPACGAGGFLSSQIQYLLRRGHDIDEIKQYVTSKMYGIDKDNYLIKLANAHVGLFALEEPNLLCTNTLEWGIKESNTASRIPEVYDVLLANPPFGAKIVAASDEAMMQYELSYKWVEDKRSGRLIKTEKFQKNTPPQVLFVEKCIKLVREGGRLGLVLPESIISNKSYRHVTQYILDHTQVHAVIGMPENLFKISGKGGTHTKVCLLVLTRKSTNPAIKEEHAPIFMAEATWCGNDSRGRKIEKDDLPIILNNYRKVTNNEEILPSPLGFTINPEDISSGVLAPRYYDPGLDFEISQLSKNHNLTTIRSLMDNNLLAITTGDEVGKMAYGTGSIPFVRTSDISNWEIKIDPKQGVSREIYDSLKRKQGVAEGDILMVRDGTYLIGTCAFVSKYDEEIVYQSHLMKIRSLDRDKMNPYLLLALLSSPIVQRQIKTKKLTLDIIDSIGNRLPEVILPIPKDMQHQQNIINIVKKAIEDRIEARELSRKAQLEVVQPMN